MGQGMVAKQAFFPPKPSYGKELEGLLFLEKRTKSAKKSRKRVPAIWWPCQISLPASSPLTDPPTTKRVPFTVLFSHGNAEDLGQLLPWIKDFGKELHVSVLAYDYMGYGLNSPWGQDHCSEEACYRDIKICYRWLLDEQRVPPERIVLFGRSIGSGPTVGLGYELAKEKRTILPYGGMVLQSPLLSCIRVVSDTLAAVPFADMFCNVDKIAKIPVPIMIVHGTEDEVIPFRHGDMLSQLTKLKCSFHAIRGAGHNNIESSYAGQYMGHWKTYILSLEERYGFGSSPGWQSNSQPLPRANKDSSPSIELISSAPITTTRKDEEEFFHRACEEGNLREVKHLLSNWNVPINERDSRGWVPLHICCNNVVEANTPLERREALEICNLLLSAGANPRITTKSDKSCLHLLARVVCANDDVDGDQAFLLSTLSRFVEKGAEVNWQNDAGISPLHEACFKGSFQVAWFLLEHNANPNLRTIQGETCLHFAVRSGKETIVKLLLTCGAKSSIKGGSGTALEIAISLKHDGIVKLLQQARPSPQSSPRTSPQRSRPITPPASTTGKPNFSVFE